MENACSKTLSKDAVPCSALVHLVVTVFSPPPPQSFARLGKALSALRRGGPTTPANPVGTGRFPHGAPDVFMCLLVCRENLTEFLNSTDTRLLVVRAKSAALLCCGYSAVGLFL